MSGKATSCVVCRHPETRTIDRFLRLAEGTPGKRGSRSLATKAGLSRRDIAHHARVCLAELEDEPDGGGG